MNYTENYNLRMPGYSDPPDIADQNSNMTAVDTALKGLSDSKEGLIKNAASKSSMADTDTLPTSESAAGNATRKITFLALKTALQAFFDTLYNYYVHPTTAGNKHVPSGGVSGQFLKYGGSSGTASWATPAKADVGLGNVDNTSDASKPVSSAVQAALDAKAPLISPAFTGTPTVAGNMVYHVGNITISTSAPSSALVEGAQHQVY